MQIPSDLVFGVRMAAPQPRVFSSEDPQVAASPAQDVMKLADTITKIGLQYEERAADLDRVRKFTEINTELTKSKADLDNRMKSHVDHETYMDTWEKGWNDIKTGVLKAARVDPYVYKAMVSATDQAYQSEYGHQKSRQRQYQVDNSKAAQERSLVASESTIRNEEDLMWDTTYHLTKLEANLPLYGAIEVEKMRQAIPKRLAIALINRVISDEKDYEKVISWLENENSIVSRAFPDPTEREDMKDKIRARHIRSIRDAFEIQRLFDDQEDHEASRFMIRALEDHYINDTPVEDVENLVAEGFYEDSLGRFSVEFMNRYKAMMDGKYRYTVGENAMYYTLATQYYGAMGRFDLATAATNAHAQKLINGAEYLELVKTSSMDSQFKQSQDWDDARQFVLHQLDPKYSSLMGSSLTRPEDQANISNAMNEVYKIWKTEPNVTADEAKMRIVQKYKAKMSRPVSFPPSVVIKGKGILGRDKIYDLYNEKDVIDLAAEHYDKLTAEQWKAVWRSMGVPTDESGKPITTEKK